MSRSMLWRLLGGCLAAGDVRGARYWLDQLRLSARRAVRG